MGMLGVGIIFLLIGLILGGEISYSIDISEQKVITKSSKSKDYVKKTLEVEDFSEIQLKLENVDAVVEVNTGDNYQVQYCLLESEIPDIAVQDGVLNINGKSGHSAVNFQFLDFEWDDDFKKDYIIITIPKEIKLSDVNIVVDYVDISLQDFIFENGNIVTEYGDIEMADVAGKTGNISSASGDIVLKNAEIENYEIKNEYGDLVLENCKGKKGSFTLESTECNMKSLEMEELQVTNVYGDIEFEKGNILVCKVENESGEISMEDCKGEEMDFKAGYGDISIEKSSWNHVKAVCENGDTEIDLRGTLSEYDLDLTTESGMIEVNEEESEGSYKKIMDGEKSIFVQSEYGEIEISVK